MLYTGIFKRIIPFALTFAAGLFIASFFVSLALPSFSWRGERRFGKCHRAKQLERENTELRLENERLRRSAEQWSEADLRNAVPPVVEFEAHKPPPPRRPKHPRFE